MKFIIHDTITTTIWWRGCHRTFTTRSMKFSSQIRSSTSHFWQPNKGLQRKKGARNCKCEDPKRRLSMKIGFIISFISSQNWRHKWILIKKIVLLKALCDCRQIRQCQFRWHFKIVDNLLQKRCQKRYNLSVYLFFCVLEIGLVKFIL